MLPHAIAASTRSRVRVARARAPTRPAAPVRTTGVMRGAPRRAARLGIATLRTRRPSAPAMRIRRRLPVLPLAPYLAAPRPPVTRRRAGRPRRRLPRKPVGHADPRLALRGFRAYPAGHVTKLPAFVRRLERPAPAPRGFAQRLVRRRPAPIHCPPVRRHVALLLRVALLRRVVLDIGRAAILSGRLHVFEGEGTRPAQHRAQAASHHRHASRRTLP